MLTKIVQAAESTEQDWTSNSVLDPIIGLVLFAIIVFEVLYVYRQEQAAVAPPPPPPKNQRKRPGT